LTPSDFDELHALLGDAPSVPDALPPGNADELLAYADALSRARALLQSAYGFSEAAVGSWGGLSE
jgi:hypothetical protein